MPATLTIKPWPDPVVDTLGHDPRSRYVETFWLPTLGPTALLLLRHLADRFDRNPERHRAHRVRHVARARARPARRHELADRAHARRGSRSSTSPATTRCRHGRGAAQRPAGQPPPPPPPARRRAGRARRVGRGAARRRAARRRARRTRRRIAFTLLEQGDDPDHVERVLHAHRLPPRRRHDSARWAYERHRDALEHARARRARPRPEPPASALGRSTSPSRPPAATSGAPLAPGARRSRSSSRAPGTRSPVADADAWPA